MKLVEIEWVDSVSDGPWTNTEDAIRRATYDAMLHRSAGYLVAEDEHMVLVACSRSENESNVADVMQIPRVAVLSVRELRRK